MKSTSLLLLIAILLAGCDLLPIGPGSSDFVAPLCGGYTLSKTSAHQIDIGPSKAYTIGTVPIIPVKVVEVGHNNRFILAKQNILKRRNPEDPKDTYMEPDSGNFQYWILDTDKPVVYGPYNAESFEDKKDELGIPADIKLRDIYYYK